MSERDQILGGLEPLFERASREGKWFWLRYQDLWFAPEELRKAHAVGRFIWGAVNWELRDPKERLSEAVKRADDALAELKRIKEKMPQ